MKNKSIIKTGVLLIGFSVILHYMHFQIFKDLHHIMIFLLADIAFIPLEVFFVTVVLDRMIEKREKANIIEKLNMLVGLFYSQLGLNIFKEFVSADECMSNLVSNCKIAANSKLEDFEETEKFLKKHEHVINIEKIDFVKLQEEFAMRDIYSDQSKMAKHDVDHLKVDCMRAYKNIPLEWLK